MTIPSTYKTTAQGSGSYVNDGGVVLGVGDVSTSRLTGSLSLDSALPAGNAVRRVVAEVSTDGSYEAAKANSSGAFGYEQAASELIMIGNDVTIGGSSSTVLKMSRSYTSRKKVQPKLAMYGAKTLTAWSEGAWNPLGISTQRTNWDAAAASVSAGGILTTLNSNYVLPSDGSTAATDNTISLTVPGNLVLTDGSLTPTVHTYTGYTTT